MIKMPESATGDLLQEIADTSAICRKVWMDKPEDAEELEYVYEPTYGISGLLIYNYFESDESLRKRIQKHFVSKGES